MSDRFEIIDRCLVPQELAELVHVLKRDVPGATLQSCYRGAEVKEQLHGLGKQTQAELYDAWCQRRPGANPANPADRGTHIGLGDGTVGALHAKLDPREVGMDWNDGAVGPLIQAAANRGWTLFRPYSSHSEIHHLNASAWPVLGAVLGMRQTDERHSVRHLTRRLAFVHGKSRQPFLHGTERARFDAPVKVAVQRFQCEHELVEDGIVGPKTWKALDASVRWHKAHRAEPHPKPTPKPTPRGPKTVAEQAAAFIAPFEGCPTAGNKPVAYQDAVGVWTIGYGHTAGVKRGDTLASVEAARRLLAEDIAGKYLRAVDDCAKRCKLDLSANQRVALCSAVYNLGPGVLSPDRSLGGALAKHDLPGAARALLLYDKAGNPARSMSGLTRRREAEKKLFESH